jgi:hypothetical protein
VASADLRTQAEVAPVERKDRVGTVLGLSAFTATWPVVTIRSA